MAKTPESRARAYCLTVGKDPDEVVDGYCSDMRVRVRRPRWIGMLGADLSLAEGAMNLSPEQVRRRVERGGAS